MAIDTRQKRFSMLNFGSISSDILFEADGTVNDDDKIVLLDMYSGNPLGTPPIGGLSGSLVYPRGGQIGTGGIIGRYGGVIGS